MAYITSVIHIAIDMLFQITGNYGWAILLLTLAIRLALIPLALWGVRTARSSAALQAEARTIREQYQGEDADQRLRELYSRSGGAMLAGCLPMLAQWPVFMAMYSALHSFTFAVPAGFFWLTNLAAPDPYFIMPLLVVGTQVWQSLVTMPREQRTMALIMPAVMGLVMIKASAALTLYWLASNLISVGQHYLLTRRMQTTA